MKWMSLLGLLFLFATGNSQPANPGDLVVFQSGETQSGTITVDFQSKESPVIKLNGSPLDIRKIKEFRKQGNLYVVAPTGQKTTSGKGQSVQNIRYQIFQQVEDGAIEIFAPVDPNTFRARAHYALFRKNGGPLYPFTYDALLPALQDDPESLRILKRYYKRKKWFHALLHLGASTTLFGLFQSRLGLYGGQNPFYEENVQVNDINPLVYVGGAILASSIVPGYRNGENLYRAVITYNQRHTGNSE